VGGEAVGGEMEIFAGGQECLAGDAADIEAGAAEGLGFFNAGGFESELGRANGGYITGGAGTDDDEVK